MTTLDDNAPEIEIRRAMAGAHRTVALAYSMPELPLLRFEVDERGLAHAFCWDPDHLTPYKNWLDDSHGVRQITEQRDIRVVTGEKEGVAFIVTYWAEYEAS